MRASDLIAALAQPSESAKRAVAFGVDFAATGRLLGLPPGHRLDSMRRDAGTFGLRRTPVIDPLAVARHLAAFRVRYVLVGGSAMRARGMDYFTEDYDICYEPSAENVGRLIAALTSLDPRLRIESRGVVVPFVLDEHTLRGFGEAAILTLETTLGNIDLLSAVDGIGGFEDVLARATPLGIGDSDVPVLTFDGLVAAKRAAGRGKDLFVLPQLEALAEIERQSGAEGE